MWRGEESGLKEKEQHKRDIGCLEPFLEAAPQVKTFRYSDAQNPQEKAELGQKVIIKFMIKICLSWFVLIFFYILCFLGFDQNGNSGSEKGPRKI